MTDSFFEDQTRQLLAVAADDLPSGGDHADLAARVQRRARARQARRRVAMSAGALATVGAIAVGLLAGLAGPAAPSAYAAVVAAVTTTSSSSFELTTISTETSPDGTLRRIVQHSEFDLAKGFGVESNGATLFAGGYIYWAIPPAHQPHGKKWYKSRGPVYLPIAGLLESLPDGQDVKATPQTLLRLLKAADQVRQTGTTPQGWTVYAYTLSPPYSMFTGTITVDQQGLVRQFVFHLHGHFTTGPHSLPIVIHSEADFTHYGIPVSVSVPPASECILMH